MVMIDDPATPPATRVTCIRTAMEWGMGRPPQKHDLNVSAKNEEIESFSQWRHRPGVKPPLNGESRDITPENADDEIKSLV